MSEEEEELSTKVALVPCFVVMFLAHLLDWFGVFVLVLGSSEGCVCVCVCVCVCFSVPCLVLLIFHLFIILKFFVFLVCPFPQAPCLPFKSCAVKFKDLCVDLLLVSLIPYGM